MDFPATWLISRDHQQQLAQFFRPFFRPVTGTTSFSEEIMAVMRWSSGDPMALEGHHMERLDGRLDGPRGNMSSE